MAGMDWFRWHHGSVTDPKFQLVARKAGSSVAEVIGVWATLLEAASMADERGCHGALDFESLDCSLGLPDGKAQEIYTLMAARALVNPESNDISAWSKRQPARERDDATAADRKRDQRERDRNKSQQDTPKAADKSHVTPCHTTSHQKQPRVEERRVEEIRVEEKTHAVVISEHNTPEPDLRVSRQAAVCMVIKSEGIGSVNPQHPDLLALIDAGADVGHFAAAAKVAKGKGKGFAYVLGIVRGQIADAKGIAGRSGVAAIAPAETVYQRSQRERYEEATGTGPARQIIDITPTPMEIPA